MTEGQPEAVPVHVEPGRVGIVLRCPSWLKRLDGATLRLGVVAACAAFWIVVVYLVAT